jgi:hypothetical protein
MLTLEGRAHKNTANTLDDSSRIFNVFTLKLPDSNKEISVQPGLGTTTFTCLNDLPAEIRYMI